MSLGVFVVKLILAAVSLSMSGRLFLAPWKTSSPWCLQVSIRAANSATSLVPLGILSTPDLGRREVTLEPSAR